MKKSSLMGASVVAAALLAAAPIAAPAVSLATPGTQVVKADSVSEQQRTLSYANKLVSTLKGSNSTDYPKLNTGSFDQSQFTAPTSQGWDKRQSISAGFAVTTGISSADFNKKYFQNGAGVSASPLEQTAATNHLSYTLYYSDARGQIFSTFELATRVNDLQKNGGKLTAHYTFYDNYSEQPIASADPVISFNSESNTKAAFIQTNDVTVPEGTSVDAFNARSSVTANGGSVLNAKGEDITSKLNVDQFKVGDVKYNVVAGKTAGSVVPKGVGETFKKGTYTQEIMFNTGNLLGSAAAADNADKAGRLTFNGHSVSDIQANKVAGMTYDPSTRWVTITRNVKVTPASASVATKDETIDPYQVAAVTKKFVYAYDGNGKLDSSMISVKGDAWQVRTKRTMLKNGQVYYEIGKDIWLKAEDVTMYSQEDWTKIYNEEHGIATATPSDSVVKGDVVVSDITPNIIDIQTYTATAWKLASDNKSMSLIDDLTFAPGSAWKTKTKAVVNGMTFYEIGNNVWINAKRGALRN